MNSVPSHLRSTDFSLWTRLGYVLAGIAKIKRLEEKFYLPSVILDSQTYNRSP